MTATRPHINRDAAQAFDVPEDVTYLNTAGFGPRLHVVNAAAESALYESSRPWEAQPDDWIEQSERLRSLAARLLKCDAEALAFTPSVSYAMAVAAQNCTLNKGDNVVVLEGEYPSNRAIWHQKAQSRRASLRFARRRSEGDWTDAVLAATDEHTAVLSLPHCHWADGRVLDLERIALLARQVGAALIIDASQSLGIMDLDFARIAPDFVVVPGHKWLLGSYGLGWLWAAKKHCEYGEPIEQTILAREAFGDFASLGQTLPGYRAGARRFDFGPYPHPLSVPMSMAALLQIEAWGIEEIRSRLAELNQYLRLSFARRGLDAGLTREPCAPHLCAWQTAEAGQLNLVAEGLSANRIIVARRADKLRFAPHLHVTETAIDHLGEVIEQSLQSA